MLGTANHPETTEAPQKVVNSKHENITIFMSTTPLTILGATLAAILTVNLASTVQSILLAAILIATGIAVIWWRMNKSFQKMLATSPASPDAVERCMKVTNIGFPFIVAILAGLSLLT